MLLRIRRRLAEVARANEWWEHKLVPVFALFYGTAVVARVPIVSLWYGAFILLLSLVPGAIYVSVINDVTDRADDLAAGKRNRMAGRSGSTIAALVAATVLPGLVFAWLWRDDALLFTAYLSAWLVYSLYSLPPFRFKTRGLAGVLCDASGAHLFPSLVAVLLVFRESGTQRDPAWLGAVAVWSFAYGVRGILWHQLFDRDNDVQADVRTFAQRHPPTTTRRLAAFVVFPVELASLGALLLQMRSTVPLLLLAVYAFFAWRRVRCWSENPVIVATRPRFFIVLHEYYDVHLPIGILIAAAMRNPLDALVIAVHLVLFPRRAFHAGLAALRLLPLRGQSSR